MYLSILILPVLGSLVSGFLGRKLGVKGSQIITTTCVVLTTLLAIIVFFEVSLNHIPVSIHLFRWIDSESLHITWGFNFDSLTVSMLIPVLIVSSLVHLYSIGYMSHDPHNQRFFSYLSLFTFMMIILVTGNNYLLMFVGWEGVGVCSYLLVSFWFTRIAANQSSLAAFLTNRVGDCFLTIGIFVLLLTFGNINYSTIFSISPFISEDIISLIGILLLLGAMAKSSQIGLHVWLPMAMEGPTPVSALIHAATMVTAGVYLLMRSSPLIEYSSTVLLLCLWIGAITTVFSSLIGLFQQDIKKVIAYSTMSQLGMMVIAVGLSSYNLALFHLVNHAFYKALLFLGAGSVIHAVADNQDFRKYGGLRAFLPLTYSVMLIASLSLVAFPFMTGFYSKDFILESAYGNFSFSTTSVYFIATIGAMFTTLYSVKVLYLTFLTNPNGPVSAYKIAHEGDIYMSLPLILLAVFSICFGYITKDLFIGLGSDVFSDNSLFIHPINESLLDTEFAVPVFFKLLPLYLTISLSLIYIIISELIATKSVTYFKFSRFGYNLYSFFNQRFLIEAFYNKFITDAILKIGGQTTKVIDKGSVELLGPFGLEKFLSNASRLFAILSTNIVVTTYALYITVFLIIYLAIIVFTSLSDTSEWMFILPIIANKRVRLTTMATTPNNGEIRSRLFSKHATLLWVYPPRPSTPDPESGSDSESEYSNDGVFAPRDGHDTDDLGAICANIPDRATLIRYIETKRDAFVSVLHNGESRRGTDTQLTMIENLNDVFIETLDAKGWTTEEDSRLFDRAGPKPYDYGNRPGENLELYSNTNVPDSNTNVPDADTRSGDDADTESVHESITSNASPPNNNFTGDPNSSIQNPINTDNIPVPQGTPIEDAVNTGSTINAPLEDAVNTVSTIDAPNISGLPNVGIQFNTNKRKREDSSEESVLEEQELKETKLDSPNEDELKNPVTSTKRKRDDSTDESELEVQVSKKRKTDDSSEESKVEEQVSKKRKRDDSTDESELEEQVSKKTKTEDLDDKDSVNNDDDNSADNKSSKDDNSNDSNSKGGDDGSDPGAGNSPTNSGGSDSGSGSSPTNSGGSDSGSGSSPTNSGGSDSGTGSSPNAGGQRPSSNNNNDCYIEDISNNINLVLDNPSLVSDYLSILSDYFSILLDNVWIIQNISLLI